MNLNLFQYIIYKDCQQDQTKWFEIAWDLKGEVLYNKAFSILKNHDLNINWQEFYNRKYKEEKG